jgi:hypothetical protein
LFFKFSQQKPWRPFRQLALLCHDVSGHFYLNTWFLHIESKLLDVETRLFDLVVSKRFPVFQGIVRHFNHRSSLVGTYCTPRVPYHPIFAAVNCSIVFLYNLFHRHPRRCSLGLVLLVCVGNTVSPCFVPEVPNNATCLCVSETVPPALECMVIITSGTWYLGAFDNMGVIFSVGSLVAHWLERS